MQSGQYLREVAVAELMVGSVGYEHGDGLDELCEGGGV